MTRTADVRAAIAARTLTCRSGNDTTALTQFTARLTPDVRAALSRALREAASADNDDALIAAIREVLATEAPDQEPAGVVFHTMEHDDGYFLAEYGTVYFADGEVNDHIDFGREVSRLLTAEFSARGEKTTALVDLRNDTVDVDDYRGDPRHDLGLPEHSDAT